MGYMEVGEVQETDRISRPFVGEHEVDLDFQIATNEQLQRVEPENVCAVPYSTGLKWLYF